MIKAAKQENIRRSFRTLIIPTLPLYAIGNASVLGGAEAFTDRARGEADHSAREAHLVG
jgi:hypothetical protein